MQTSQQRNENNGNALGATALLEYQGKKEQPAEMEQLLEFIAASYLGCETLKIRQSDSLDFFDCGVGALRAALACAFEAGQEFERQQGLQRPNKERSSKTSSVNAKKSI